MKHHYSTRIAYYKDDTFVQVFTQIQLNVFSSIKLFTNFIKFVDIKSKSTHVEVLIGYYYSVVRPHFISNQALGVDCT